MECQCSAPYRTLEGLEALGYAREHLTLAWSNGAVQSSGYLCPDSGQLWLMDYPSTGEDFGPVRLRIVNEEEWAAEEPSELDKQRHKAVHNGQRWRAVKDVPTGGVTTWNAPFTGGFEGVLPRGTVITVDNDPPMGARAVYCIPDNYEELERLLVSQEDRDASHYSGYALVISLADFGEAFVLL